MIPFGVVDARHVDGVWLKKEERKRKQSNSGEDEMNALPNHNTNQRKKEKKRGDSQKRQWKLVEGC